MIVREGIGVSVPPRMLHDIHMFAVGSYAMRLIDWLDNVSGGMEMLPGIEIGEEAKTLKSKLEGARRTLRSYASMLGSRKIDMIDGSDHYFADLNLAGWSTGMGSSSEIEKLFKEGGYGGVHCYLMETDQMKPAATWDDWSIVLYAWIPKPDISLLGQVIDGLVRQMNDLRVSVSHELVHMVQVMGNLMNQRGQGGNAQMQRGFFGMPTRKVRYEGVGMGGQHNRGGEGEILRDPYYLQDAEFYSNLGDEMGTLALKLRGISKEKRMSAAKVFVGEGGVGSPFFEFLKKFDRARWQLAVKRMMSWLGEQGLI